MRFIKDLQEGEFVISYSQVRSKEIRLKRNGDPYLRLVFSDSTGRIEGKMWENIEGCQKEIHEGDFVKYQGAVQIYNGSKELIVQQIRRTISQDCGNGFNLRDLIACTEHDIEEMWRRLRSLVLEHTTRPCILQLLNNVLDGNEEQIKSYPAGVEIHHNYWGGFLEHGLSVLESALFFADKYPDLDKDLLIAGAILHDIGKLEELSRPYSPSYTARGQLIGHVVLGCNLLRSEAARIPEFPANLLLLLEHLILSHQGQLEWGSPKRPKIPEALILHYIDDLDAKMNRFSLVLKEDREDSDFTQFDRYLGRAIFKGDYENSRDYPLVASPSE
ncbi:3'-5' exoribonuclease YhaM family protein [Acidobacteria bacterium AH-259-O06]|nr:3'-5' exoribonuclease YhaM family protein [Acidobacteria bacterium AH-259-O06]